MTEGIRKKVCAFLQLPTHTQFAILERLGLLEGEKPFCVADNTQTFVAAFKRARAQNKLMELLVAIEVGS